MSLFFIVLHLCFSAPTKKQAQAQKIPESPESNYVHFQSFNDPLWDNVYFPSSLPQYDGEWIVKPSNLAPHEKMLFTRTSNAHYALSTKFDSPLNLHDQTLVIQYETRFQESLNCGGAYIKVFGSNGFDPNIVGPSTPYVILFGPDRCGNTDKVMFNFRHKDSKTGQIVEHVLNNSPPVKNDKLNHLYTLIVRPDNSFEILIDAISAVQGNLLTDFTPPVNPPREVDDPNDKKPDDWVEDEMYPDPSAKKPDDWDEEAPEFIANPNKLNPPRGWLLDESPMIPDPAVPKPADWNDDFFGHWEAPLIDNPKCEEAPGCGKYFPPAIKNPEYKGKWQAPKIKNPAYKGVWAPRKIQNANFYDEASHVHNFLPIGGVGFEFTTMHKGIGFNNVLISTDEATVHRWNRLYFYAKRRQQNLELRKYEPKEGSLEFEKPKATPKPPRKIKKATLFGGQQQTQQAVVSGDDFVSTLINAWIALYNTNQILAVGLPAAIILLPMFMIVVVLLVRPAGGQAPPRPSKGKKHSHGRRRKVVYEYSDGEEEEKNDDDHQKTD